MIKAVFFDIDGTLVSHNLGTVPEDTRDALARLQEKGIQIFISSGRHILELEQLAMDDIPFDGYVLLNGQVCLDGKREVLCNAAIQEEDIKNVLQVFEERRLPIGFVEKDRIYANMIDERVRAAQTAVSSPLPPVEEYRGDDVYLVMIFAEDEACNEVLKQMPHCKMTRWNSYGVDIVDESGGKVAGMEKMLAIHGIAREEIMAFGDGENDMEMLEFSGIGVAMGNAEEAVKTCADYVTLDVDSGGIVSALEHFGIL